MPLIKSKSPKAFEKNIKAEMSAGKPQAQSLAIAYDIQRKAKKMWKGGIAGKSMNPPDNLESTSVATSNAWFPDDEDMEDSEMNIDGEKSMFDANECMPEYDDFKEEPAQSMIRKIIRRKK